MTRVLVGVTGLATVLLLIGLASAFYSLVNKEDPVIAEGASKPEVVANMTDSVLTNDAAAEKDEPIAELGIAPRTAETPAPAITPYPIPAR